MTPRLFLVWLVLSSTVGWAVYQLKYQVQRLEEQLARINHAVVVDQEAIDVLRAEWSYLNQPGYLEDVAKRYRPDLVPMQGQQFADLLQVPLKAGVPDRSKPTPPMTIPAPAPGAPLVPPPVARGKAPDDTEDPAGPPSDLQEATPDPVPVRDGKGQLLLVRTRTKL